MLSRLTAGECLHPLLIPPAQSVFSRFSLSRDLCPTLRAHSAEPLPWNMFVRLGLGSSQQRQPKGDDDDAQSEQSLMVVKFVEVWIHFSHQKELLYSLQERRALTAARSPRYLRARMEEDLPPQSDCFLSPVKRGFSRQDN